MKRMILILSVLPVALFGAGVAHADSQDNQYLQAVAALGVTAPPEGLIAAGHAICDGMGNTVAMYGVEAQVLGAGVPYPQMGQVFVAAGRAYCPEKMHSFGLS
jgi:hypothetical protein